MDILKAHGLTTVLLFHNYEAIVEAAKQHKINVFVVDAPLERSPCEGCEEVTEASELCLSLEADDGRAIVRRERVAVEKRRRP